MADVAKFSAIISRQLQELESRRQELSDSTATVQLDQSRVGRLSRMDALQGQAMQLETQRRVEQQIKRLNAALLRVDTDDFGYCKACEEPIAEARLEMNPAVLFCIACAEKKEQQR
ncbi:MAG: TraR/DksA C4-type zinc finger protein [Pseudomonadota bacterium]